ncbi:Quinoprotein amine dehydrogenase beta chain-like [Heracleum sosnowskyi]|uniref:Quinoprotein amine dehydrogenase beta chain-like n=1 Tax=Heracleum sosnowskyi TaxID=360622 RepID=A0AAD8I1R4_9APIA|nr:Quinoprotein amine dehydrogenase beta chain-like [Heracleum sosnowskyi]
MYMTYGWPQAIPLESSKCPASEHIIYIKVLNHLLLVVAPSHFELWSSTQHRVRLGKYKRDSDSIRKEGENSQAVWRPDGKFIAVLTSSYYLHLFKVQFTDKRIQIGGKQPSSLYLASFSVLLSEQVPIAKPQLSMSNIVCDNKNLLVGLSDGSLYNISWKGEFYGAFELEFYSGNGKESAKTSHSRENGHSLGGVQSVPSCSQSLTVKPAIIHLEFSMSLRLLFVLFSDGQLVLCSVSKKGLKQSDSIKAEKQLEPVSNIRYVSLYDWGYSVDDTGAVSCIAWSPDNCAFSVGWKLRGLTVWSVSGCRLMSTIRQIGSTSVSPPVFKSNQDCKYEPMLGGTSLVQWDEYGYRLYAAEERSSERVLTFSFGKSCLNRGVSGSTYARQVVYGEDRLLVVQSEATDELKLLHVKLPVSYISQNWPVLHAAASKDGMYLAVAGLHGLIIYDIKLNKWRFFGDITQEQKIQCRGLLWMGKVIIVCNYVDSSNTYELLFYPRYHLDESSLLCQKQLLAQPTVMDVYQDYLLVTYRPFNVNIFHVKLCGELTPLSTAYLQLSTVRELSIMTAKSHPAAMRFIPDQLEREHIPGKHTSSSVGLSTREPLRCLILRTDGELSVLDFYDGREKELTDSIELFWVTCGRSDGKTNLIGEVSWLDYGHRGMQVWYPSSGLEPFQQEDSLQLDPELEFDREVYPLGLLPSAGVIVGVSQRMSFSSCTEFPCFEPTPQAQTILHCLLRHLLQRDKNEEALQLAQLSAEKPNFSHCFEWLLFTVFEAEISRQSASRNQSPVPSHAESCSLLEKTCDLIKKFPDYFDVVVRVARKTDGRHWADLFSAAGRSTELFEECFQRRWYRTAAGYILVIAKLEGAAVSQYCALRLLQATLDESLYELAGELVRFLLRSGREYESTVSDSEKSSSGFLGYFSITSSFHKQSVEPNSPPFKQQNAHIASVKNILGSHASYLMSGKELSKLVAFVKGTQFDLVEFLQRERYGSARLDNFAAGLELVGQKLRMGILQSRLDAEFLLAHMCSVKFKEWIVVLATLLRRSEILLDLFQHDTRLWKAYSTTIQSHSAFTKYHDLLGALEGKLSLTRESEET